MTFGQTRVKFLRLSDEGVFQIGRGTIRIDRPGIDKWRENPARYNHFFLNPSKSLIFSSTPCL